jgi:hypothetical protein
VDVDPTRESSAPYLAMNSNDVLPASLDVGQHGIVAIATRDTQMGPQPVGWYDQQLRLADGDFR